MRLGNKGGGAPSSVPASAGGRDFGVGGPGSVRAAAVGASHLEDSDPTTGWPVVSTGRDAILRRMAVPQSYPPRPTPHARFIAPNGVGEGPFPPPPLHSTSHFSTIFANFPFSSHPFFLGLPHFPNSTHISALFSPKRVGDVHFPPGTRKNSCRAPPKKKTFSCPLDGNLQIWLCQPKTGHPNRPKSSATQFPVFPPGRLVVSHPVVYGQSVSRTPPLSAQSPRQANFFTPTSLSGHRFGVDFRKRHSKKPIPIRNRSARILYELDATGTCRSRSRLESVRIEQLPVCRGYPENLPSRILWIPFHPFSAIQHQFQRLQPLVNNIGSIPTLPRHPPTQCRIIYIMLP